MKYGKYTKIWYRAYIFQKKGLEPYFYICRLVCKYNIKVKIFCSVVRRSFFILLLRASIVDDPQYRKLIVVSSFLNLMFMIIQTYCLCYS